MNTVKKRPLFVSVTALLVALVALLAVACGQVKRPDGGFGLLPNGAGAPEVVARGPTGEEVRLTSLRGKAVVVYFYPCRSASGGTTA